MVAIATCSGALIAGAAAPATAAPTQAAPTQAAPTQTVTVETRAPSDESPDDSVSAQTQAVYKYVWHTADSYKHADPFNPTGGKLFAGWNYFYCQAAGFGFSDLGYKNYWWLKTDDDSGNSKVWVNAIYVSGGDNNSKIPGVPEC